MLPVSALCRTVMACVASAREGRLPRLRAEFRRVAAVAATNPRIGTDPQRGVSSGNEGEEDLEVKSMACRGLLEALGGRSKVKQQEKAKGSQASPLRGHSGGQCPPHQRVAGVGWSRRRIIEKENESFLIFQMFRSANRHRKRAALIM